MTGDDFIALAGLLVVRPDRPPAGANPTPAVLRTAVSRAYYGAMHMTREYLSALGVNVAKKHDLHVLLCNCDNHDAAEAGKRLNDLYSRRLKADYELGRSDVEQIAFARYTVEKAHQFRSYLDKCRIEPARSSIGDRIKADQERKP